MDSSTIQFLFSAVFVLIGSLAFHISALVSGHDIYRDLPTHESTLLSIVAGIVIFLLSPISFIILQSSTNYANISVQILDFRVLLAFFGCAFGLGLIFGCWTMLKARVNLLEGFREKSGLRFWIYSYGLVWDDFLSSVKRKGEVSVQTDDGTFKGVLRSYSIKDEPKEIFLDKPKIKIYGREEDIEGEENAGLLISGSKIKRIIVPERSFRKHIESMGHISQAFYWIILAIGLIFLSFSAYLTRNYMLNLELGLVSFYGGLSLIFLALTIFVLGISVWVAQKDFDNWKSFFMLSPNIAFLAIFFSLLPILQIIHFITHISYKLILIFLIPYIFLFPLLYIYKIGNWLKKTVKDRFDKIKKDFEGKQKLLEEVLQSFYSQLSCNEKDKARISGIMDEILETYLFRWDSVPGHDNEKLIGFLVDDLAIDWAENAIVNKSSDGKIINIAKDEHSAEIKMDDNGEKATLLIRDDRTCEFKVKTKNDRLIIYLEKYKNDEKEKIINFVKNLDELKGFLFSLNLTSNNSLEADLESGSISSGTSDAFQANEHPLPDNSIIWIKEDNKWVIGDRERKKIYYIVWKEEGKLKIYNKDKEYLEREDFNIIVAFKYFIKKGIYK